MTLDQHSDNHIRECFAIYQEFAPFEAGELLKVFDDEGRLYGIGRCLAVYWNEDYFEWCADVELMESFGLCIGNFMAWQIVRHTGFLGRLA